MASGLQAGHHDHSQIRRVRGPDALELVAVAFISLAVLATAAAFMPSHIHTVQTVEAYSVAEAIEPDMIVAHSLYGAWPGSRDATLAKLADQATGRYAHTASFQADHTLVVRFDLSGQTTGEERVPRAARRLTFRPVLLGAPGADSVMFLCGHARPPAGERTVFGTDTTTLPANDLPPGCRKDW
jgi:hypothetical protein